MTYTLYNGITIQAKPGQFIIVDPTGVPVCIRGCLTSWAAESYQAMQDGSLRRTS